MARLFRREKPPVSVTYVAKPADGSPDQTLTLVNRSETSARPTLSFVPHNMYGHPLPDVTVQSVLGTDRGIAMLPANGTLQDVLRFDGPGHHQVRGVQVSTTEVEQLDHPALEQDVRVVMVDLQQHATLEPTEFWGVGIANANPFGVQVRVALVHFEDREGDHPRQVDDVVVLDGDVDVASASHEVIWLPEDVRGHFHHVVHCLIPPTLV